uniref:Homeobox C6a n=1 Tax=Gadus morhua TaxID=8049 RepID=A0A8C5F9I8_GADMO
MNSYFANPSISCHLSGGQDVLPNVPLNSTTYDTVRHFSSYGAAVSQNRIYAPFYSPQDNVVFGSGRAQYEYGSNVFLQDKDGLPSCRQTNMGLSSQSHISQEYTLDQARGGPGRMNSHSGVGYGSDRRRGRQIYSRYQTLELEKEVPLQPLLDEAQTHRNRQCPLFNRTPDQNLVSEPPHEMEDRRANLTSTVTGSEQTAATQEEERSDAEERKEEGEEKGMNTS